MNNSQPSQLRGGAVCRQAGFSLIEIMVVVALLSVIIIGLVTMFNQVQRAFTSSVNQIDLLEGGRLANEMIARELGQMTPGCYSNSDNFDVIPSSSVAARFWPLAVAPDMRTNTFQQVYFLTKYKQQWNGIGYEVDPGAVPNGVGTLYRYGTNNIPPGNLAGQAALFANSALNTNFTRVIDGVVNFRVRAYDLNGNLIVTNAPTMFGRPQPGTGEMLYTFTSNAVPAYVEVELGVLETRTLERYKTFTNNSAIALNYLTNHAGQVHIFRQRIPIRTVDPTAYQ